MGAPFLPRLLRQKWGLLHNLKGNQIHFPSVYQKDFL